MRDQAPIVTHYVVADDSRARFLVVGPPSRWSPVQEDATRFTTREAANQARDARPLGYITIPVIR